MGSIVEKHKCGNCGYVIYGPMVGDWEKCPGCGHYIYKNG
jgi:hypothetical protein